MPELSFNINFSLIGRIKIRLSIFLIKLAELFAKSAIRNVKVENA